VVSTERAVMQPVTSEHPSPVTKALIEVRGLKKYFPVRNAIFGAPLWWIKAVDGIDFTVRKGETFGLVGESGCGKTTTSRMILRLERPTVGTILVEGRDIGAISGDELRAYRRSLQAVFQDPTSSLNPRMRVEEIVGEPLIANDSAPVNVVKARVAQVLSEVGLPQTSALLYPHEFSGGQRQRIAIARSLVSGSNCIILDEPVSALDISIRAQILNLLKELQHRRGLTYVLIAHDLAAVKYLSHRIGVMYLGKFAELADTEELYANPMHPYTKALLSAALPSNPNTTRREITITGEVPSALTPPAGCRFHPRCPIAESVCSEIEPSLRELRPNHWVACHLADRVDSVITLSFEGRPNNPHHR
jgi:oligopeptide transport system ATP-binding protein